MERIEYTDLPPILAEIEKRGFVYFESGDYDLTIVGVRNLSENAEVDRFDDRIYIWNNDSRQRKRAKISSVVFMPPPKMRSSSPSCMTDTLPTLGGSSLLPLSWLARPVRSETRGTCNMASTLTLSRPRRSAILKIR